MPDVQAVLFDLDDTLFDHQHSCRAGLAAVQNMFPERLAGPIEQLESRYRSLLEDSHMQVLDGLLSIDESRVERFQVLLSSSEGPANAEVAHAAASNYRDEFNAAYRPVPGAVELVALLRQHARIGVITNHVVDEQVKKVAAIGIESLIDELVISEEVGVTKPDPLIFHTALNRLKTTADRAVMIGDSWPSDIEGAIGIGVRAIWLNRYHHVCPDPSLAVEIQSLQPIDEIALMIRQA